jgi:hypothetical protein
VIFPPAKEKTESISKSHICNLIIYIYKQKKEFSSLSNALIIDFLGGRPPGHPRGTPGNRRGFVIFCKKNSVPWRREIVWVL